MDNVISTWNQYKWRSLELLGSDTLEQMDSPERVLQLVLRERVLVLQTPISLDQMCKQDSDHPGKAGVTRFYKDGLWWCIPGANSDTPVLLLLNWMLVDICARYYEGVRES